MAVPGWLADDARVVAVRHRARLAGATTDWPSWLPEEVRESIVAAGIGRPWTHQVVAAEAAWSGATRRDQHADRVREVLAYLMPIMAATAVLPPQRASLGVTTGDLRSRLGVGRHTALYLAPTKALAHDQRVSARRLGPPGWQVATLDGDSATDESASPGSMPGWC